MKTPIIKGLSETGVLTSPLKWAGGKRWLVPILKFFYHSSVGHRLVEPFCGGLSVAFGLTADLALLNDINPHTINFFTHLKRGLTIDTPLLNEKEAYGAARMRFNELIHSQKETTREAAGLFYYLNRTGFNGLCRFNASGGFNVPFGRHKTINYQTDFGNYSQRMQGWEFKRDDFARLKIKSTDFIYADPPYDVPFTQYSRENFKWADQVRLVDWLLEHKGPVILSNQATDRILELYKDRGFMPWKILAPRNMSCKGCRAPAVEVLAFRGFDKAQCAAAKKELNQYYDFL